MDTFTTLSVVALAALIHSSFQLSISVVTLLSGHSIGKKVAAQKTLRLVGAFLAGTAIMTTLIVCTLLYTTKVLDLWQQPGSLWSVVALVLVVLGVAVWALYYRRGEGTPLWIPRAFARFLQKRVHTTSMSVEAFSLGLTTVIAELPFIAAPMVAAMLALSYLPANLQLLSALGYIIIASSSILLVTMLIGSGHSISRIQRWREHNKRFLQFVAGSGFIVLGIFLYVSQVVSPGVVAAGVQ